MNLPAVETKCRAAIEFARAKGKVVAPTGLCLRDHEHLCLMGAVLFATRDESAADGRQVAYLDLGLTPDEGYSLEYGFCDWQAEPGNRQPAHPDLAALAALGSRLAGN